MAEQVLEARDLSKSYRVDDRRITVLDNISMTVKKGEFLVIEGKSGSGKSTLLSLLSGLDKPDSGRIILHGTDITRAERRPARAVPQPDNRLRVSILPPGPLPDRPGKHHVPGRIAP